MRLRQLLELPHPAYGHLPVLLDPNGRKLSKQNHVEPIASAAAGANLHHCLSLLGQAPPAALHGAGADEVMQWALAHWNARTVPRTLEMPAGDFAA